MVVASVACVGVVRTLPQSLYNIWVSLAVFMGTQVGRWKSTYVPIHQTNLTRLNPDITLT